MKKENHKRTEECSGYVKVHVHVRVCSMKEI